MFKFSLLCATSLLVSGFADGDPLAPTEISLTSPSEKRADLEKRPALKGVFSPFTGKVKGEKVRVRLQPDLEGAIIRELNKNELISVLGDEGNFWVVQPPENVKAYVFRSFILDNVVEGNRVNVRLEPDLEAPIIGHLNAGDHIDGTICETNKKWLEIAPPSQTKFYVSKDYIEFAGGPEYKTQMEKRKAAVQHLIESSALLSKAEMQKSFEEIDFDRMKHNYQSIVQDYADFPEYVQQAKEALAQMQENYLQKRIAHLESKAYLAKTPTQKLPEAMQSTSDRMKMWEPIEEALYTAWSRAHNHKGLEEYYEEQKMASIHLTGILEAAPIKKNKPGDYILKDKNLPVAYLYSTSIDLHDFVGKQITLVGSPRPNHNFAFPAYYVHSIE